MGRLVILRMSSFAPIKDGRILQNSATSGSNPLSSEVERPLLAISLLSVLLSMNVCKNMGVLFAITHGYRSVSQKILQRKWREPAPHTK